MPPWLIVAQLAELVGGHAEWVVAAADDRLLELLHLLFTLERLAVLQQGRVPSPAAVVDDRHKCLSRHVAPEDDHVGLVVLAAVEELAPADLGAVHVGGEKDSR